jgi:nucleoside-diphosphate-sugar epimerase
MADSEKPSVLIIGGLGYLGRFLAKYIHENDLASEVRLVDKVLPQLAWLADEFKDACSQDKFMQADASRERESSLSLALTMMLCPSSDLMRWCAGFAKGESHFFFWRQHGR